MMRHLYAIILLIGLFHFLPDSLLSNDQYIHILFTESTNGFLQNCECPVQPFGGMARRKTILDSIRTVHENIILVDAGNFLSTFNRSASDSLMINLIEQLNYNAINFGQNENRYFKQISHTGNNKQLAFTTLNFSKQMDGINRKNKIELKTSTIKIIVLGIFNKSQYNQLDVELNNIKSMDFVILLSKLKNNENRDLVNQYANQIDCIIGNHSEDILVGQWKKYKNCHLLKAGIDGQSIGHIKLATNPEIRIDDIQFYKVKQWILPDPDFIKQINNLEEIH